jgi:ribosome-binding protein aMBF1 (putative translation factor)
LLLDVRAGSDRIGTVSAFRYRRVGGGLRGVRKAIHNEEYRRFCAGLRDLRERAGLQQSELAERLGVTQSVVSSWEGGHRRLDIVELEQIATALGTTLARVVRLYGKGE